MNACKNEILDAIEAELVLANEIHPPFASLHEAYAVTREEFEEADDELRLCNDCIQKAWHCITENQIAVIVNLSRKGMKHCILSV